MSTITKVVGETVVIVLFKFMLNNTHLYYVPDPRGRGVHTVSSYRPGGLLHGCCQQQGTLLHLESVWWNGTTDETQP